MSLKSFASKINTVKLSHIFHLSPLFRSRLSVVLSWLMCLGLLSACSTSKFIPDGEYYLDKVSIRSDNKQVNASSLEPYIRQKANSRWFSIFKIPLATYSLAGRDTSKWVNRTLQKIGEEPVVYDTVQARLSMNDLKLAMQNLGYMNASVELKTKTKGKKLKATYLLHPGEPYYINSIKYDIQDERIDSLLQLSDLKNQGIKAGDPFTVARLDEERKRITNLLLNNGYYRFHKDFIMYGADSLRGTKNIDIVLHLLKYRATTNMPETHHPRYYIRNVYFHNNDSNTTYLRPKVLWNNSWMKEGDVFSASDLQRTYNNFAKLRAVRYTNIRFVEVPDTTLLDCHININHSKRQSVSFQPEGTNTAGNLGAAASVTYENRNLFKGSEVFSLQFRAAFEAITGLEGYQNKDYKEFGVESKLHFPRFVAPFLSLDFRRKSNATSELSVGWNLQNRPEFHRRVYSTAWRYLWSVAQKNLSYRLDLLDLNYVYMPWISPTFKADYLDNNTHRNAILRYNYEDLFIAKLGFGMSYNDGTNVLRTNIETAGNVLNAVSLLTKGQTNKEGHYSLFNIAYAQYVKLDVDYTRLIKFDMHNSLALHAGLGVAYPYGNSTILPFEKRYFSGGANSVRGWSVRELGPGNFRGTDGRIDFINQTGDVKLDMNVEFRTFLFWKLHGAAFIDAGNIWTLRNYADQPGGQFKLNKFYEQIAVAYGLGFRLNFDYFIIRFDLGMKAINPAYANKKEHYAFLYPKLSRDFKFHFAVGLPF